MELTAYAVRAVFAPLAIACCCAGHAEAAVANYEWSGFVEGLGDDIFGYGGDGNQRTVTDGNPFTLSVSIAFDAFDGDANSGRVNTIPNAARFIDPEFTLTIGGVEATVSGAAEIRFQDEPFGPADDITFVATVLFGGVDALFVSYVRLPPSTFELEDLGVVDPPPVFGSTEAIEFSSVGTFAAQTTVLPGSVVTGALAPAVPEPATALVFIGLGTVAVARRRD